MRCARWAIHVWPGLPELWQRGSWSSLLVAVLFGALLNLALVSSLVWTEWLTSTVNLVAWGTVFLASVSSLGVGLCGLRKPVEVVLATTTDLFQAAQGEYLKGNWFEAETMLVGLVRKQPRDVDAQLLLATLLRHTRRFDEAGSQLDQIERLAGAEKWSLEIGRERERLNDQKVKLSVEDRSDSGESVAEEGSQSGAPEKLLQAA